MLNELKPVMRKPFIVFSNFISIKMISRRQLCPELHGIGASIRFGGRTIPPLAMHCHTVIEPQIHSAMISLESTEISGLRKGGEVHTSKISLQLKPLGQNLLWYA